MTVGGKTPSLCTRVVVVPGQCCPELDHGGVQDTLPHSSSSLTQANPVSLASERLTKVAPHSRDPGASRQERSCSSPCISSRPCFVLREHVSSSEAKQDLSTDPQRLSSECVHRLSTLQDGDRAIGTGECAPFRMDVLDRSVGRILTCSDSPRIIQVPAVGSFANGSFPLPGSTIRAEYSATDIHPYSGVNSQSHKTKVLSSRACVSRRLAVPTPKSRDASRIGTRDSCVPLIPGV